MNSPVDFALRLLNAFETGNVFLTTGNHVHKILTRGKPQSVWISETDNSGLPVCQGDINMFGIFHLDDGFLLYADVKTDTLQLTWQALLADVNNLL